MVHSSLLTQHSFFSVIDSLSGLLAPTGLLSVADFYVQSFNNFSGKTYTGGFLGRHVNWFSRQFWRIWFEFDRVNLDEGRRDYLEYRFGCIISINNRWNNLYLLFPFSYQIRKAKTSPGTGWSAVFHTTYSLAAQS